MECKFRGQFQSLSDLFFVYKLVRSLHFVILPYFSFRCFIAGNLIPEEHTACVLLSETFFHDFLVYPGTFLKHMAGMRKTEFVIKKNPLDLHLGC